VRAPLIHALPRICREASNEWVYDNAPRLGASVAFYTLLSLAPVIVLVVAAAAVMYGQDAAEGRLASEIRGVAGPEIARAIQKFIRGAWQPGTGALATVLGLVTLVFGASSVFVELHDAMNTIWHVPRPLDRTNAAAILRLIKDRFYSFAIVLGTGFLLLVSVVVNAWIEAVSVAVPRFVTFLISYLVVAALFATLYKVVPDVSLNWSDVVPGAVITALLFMLGREIMGLYFTQTGFGSAYSAAGSPMVVLMWIYYSAQLFFWGAEFSKIVRKARRGSWSHDCSMSVEDHDYGRS